MYISREVKKMNIFIKNKLFRKLSIASFLSNAWDILFYLALMTYASKLKNYSLALSLIAISESIPKMFDSLGGYFADKTKNKLNRLVWLACMRGVLYLLVGFLFAQNISGWNLVLMVIAINFISDSIGVYSGGLQSPVIVDIVGEEEVAEATGFNVGISQMISTIVQFVGSGLLLLMSYSTLAIINGLTFMLAGLLFYIVSSQKRKSEKVEAKENNEINDQGFFKTILLSFKQVKKAPGLLTTIMVLAMLNGVLGSLEPLISIVIAGNKQSMTIVNYTFTIALIGASMAIGVSLGGLFGTKLFKKTHLMTLSAFTSIIAIGNVIAIISKNIFICLTALFILGVFIGTISPKLTQWLVTTVDRKILSSSVGLLNTLLLVIAPLMTTIFTTISASLNVEIALYILLATCIATLLTNIYVARKTK